MAQTKIKNTVCSFCPHYCGMLSHVEDGKLVKIEPNPQHPFSQGFACERNRLALKWLNHPDQLMYPLKRAGERGEGKWEKISWDQANAEIGEKLNELRAKYGPETYAASTIWPSTRQSWAMLLDTPVTLRDRIASSTGAVIHLNHG
jgi:thiosulfate reductase/polysulfide reductase chain A